MLQSSAKSNIKRSPSNQLIQGKKLISNTVAIQPNAISSNMTKYPTYIDKFKKKADPNDLIVSVKKQRNKSKQLDKSKGSTQRFIEEAGNGKLNSKRTKSYAKNDVFQLNKYKSVNKLSTHVLSTKPTIQRVDSNKLIEFTAKDAESKFKTKFGTKSLNKGGFKTIFQGELIVNKDHFKPKDPDIKRKKSMLEFDTKLVKDNNTKLMNPMFHNFMTNEDNRLNKQITCKDKFYKTSRPKINQIAVHENNYYNLKDQTEGLRVRKSKQDNKKNEADSKQVPQLKKVKSERVFDKKMFNLNLDHVLPVKNKRSLSRAKGKGAKDINTERPVLKTDIREKEMMLKRPKSKIQRKESTSRVTMAKILIDTDLIPDKKQGVIVKNIKYRSLLAMTREEKELRAALVNTLNKKKSLKKGDVKNEQKKESLVKKMLLQDSVPRKKIKAKAELELRNDSKKKTATGKQKLKAKYDRYFMQSVVKIQRWWIKIYRRNASLEMIEIDDMSESDNKTVVLLNTKTHRDNKSNQKLYTTNSEREKNGARNKIENNNQHLMLQASKGDSLQNILDLYESLHNEQLDKWKGFYNTIKRLENRKTLNDPLLHKIKSDSIKAINFLSNKLNDKPDLSDLIDIAPLAPLNIQPNISMVNSMSIDNKSFEKFILPPASIRQKHTYDLFKDNFLNQSGRNSKSLILPKPSTDKSVKSEISRQKKDDSIKDNISDFYGDSRDIKRLKPHAEIQPKQNVPIPSLYQSREPIIDFILSETISELISDPLYLQLIERSVNQGIQISVLFVQRYLNDISEYIIFNHLQEIKESMSTATSYDLSVTLRKQQNHLNCAGNTDNKILSKNLFDELTSRVVIYDPEFYSQRKIIETFSRCMYNSLDEALIYIKNSFLQIYPYMYANINIIGTSDDEGCLEDIASISLLEKACNTVLAWNDTMCGIIIGKNELKHVITQMDYINQVRDERMTKLLVQYTKDEQLLWHPRADELISLANEISNEIEEEMFAELALEISKCN